MAPAVAQNFTNTVFFGDSNSDSGRYLYLPRQKGNPATYATQGAYTTNPGPEWSVALGQLFGIAVTPSDAPGGGNNYAAGGARVTFENPTSNAWSTQSQIAAYLASTGGRADPNALYVYWVGVNDLKTSTSGGFGNIVSPMDSASIAALAQQAIGQVASLASAGARYIVVPNTFAVSAEAFTAAGYTYNANTVASRNLYDQTVWNGLAGRGVNFVPADFNSVFNYVLLHPGQFGITNTNVNTPACGPTTPAYDCGPANYVTPNADRTYYWADGPLSATGGGHVTTAVQKIEADYVYSLLVAPSMISMLGEAPLKTRDALIAAVQSQIPISLQQRGPAGFNTWVSGDVASLKINNYNGFPNDPGIPGGLTGGVDFRHGSWIVGAALSTGGQTANFSGGFGSFRQSEASATLYAATVAGPLWFDAVATAGALQFDVNRNVPLGTATMANAANTTGSSLSLAGEAGYRFQHAA